jgi:hypothetical protein
MESLQTQTNTVYVNPICRFGFPTGIFFLLVAIFVVIKQPRNRRIGFGRNLHEIQPILSSQITRLVQTDRSG